MGISPTSSHGGSGSAVTLGASLLIFRYTVAGSDKASIDTGVDTPDAGSNDWTGADLLEVFALIRGDDAGATAQCDYNVNNDGAGNYDVQAVHGTSATITAVVSNATSSWYADIHGSGGSAGYAAAHHIWIPDFAGTTFNKTGFMATNRLDATAGNNQHELHAIGWRSTAAITRLKVAARTTQKFKVGSQLLIYKRLSS